MIIQNERKKWLVLVALDQEIKDLSYIFTNFSQGNWYDHKWLLGQVNKQSLLVTVTGVGKVHAALTTQHWIDEFKPNFVLVLGLAGSLTSQVKQGNLVIGHKLIQHDVISNPIFPPHHIPRPDRKTLLYDFYSDQNLVVKACQVDIENKLHQGVIVSGDHFIANDIYKKKQLTHEFGAIAVDMESAAIAQVCYINKVPLLVVQTISDSADNKAVETFEKFLPKASEQITNFVKMFFR